MISHDPKSYIACHFDCLDLMNAVVPSTLHDADTSINVVIPMLPKLGYTSV